MLFVQLSCTYKIKNTVSIIIALFAYKDIKKNSFIFKLLNFIKNNVY